VSGAAISYPLLEEDPHICFRLAFASPHTSSQQTEHLWRYRPVASAMRLREGTWLVGGTLQKRKRSPPRAGL